MTYVVRWVPTGPEMTVNCASPTEALDLADELMATGRSVKLSILKDGCEINLAALQSDSGDEAAHS